MTYKFFLSIFRTGKVQYTSPLSHADVIRGLEELVQPATFNPFTMLTSPKSYEGIIRENIFRISPFGLGKKMRPDITGDIMEEGDQTIIKLQFKMGSFEVILYGLFFFALAFVIAEMIWLMIFGKLNPAPYVVVVVCTVLIAGINIAHQDSIVYCNRDIAKALQVLPQEVTF